MPQSPAPDGRGWPRPGEPQAYAPAADDGWGPSTAVYGGGSAPQRATRAAERDAELRARASADALRTAKPPERGLPWWAALLLLVVIAGIGGLIDTLGSIDVKGGFNFGIVAASVIAVLAVKRSHMFPIVIAPPIVYSAAAISQLYIRSGGLSNRKVILDAAANYLVYGFPAIAAATAAVLIIAGLRLIVRK